MATVYTDWSSYYTPAGGSARRYRGWLTYTTSQTDTTVTVSASSGIEQNLAMSVSYTDTQTLTDKTSYTGTTTFTYSSGDTNHTCISTKTYPAFTRGHSAVTKTLKIAVHATDAASASGWNTTTLTKSVNITIPAKTNYAVSYNANGGSGTIANQTKWYGENLTLESSGFTRANYTLKGWNTSADGTGTDYALGATYTGNAALTLYAVWELNAVVTSTKVSGAWKSGFLYAKINGVWKIPFAGYVKVSGVWKQIEP